MKQVSLASLLLGLESGARPKGGATSETGEIPSIGAEHLADDGGFKFDKMKRVPRKFFDSMRSGKISPEDILIVKSPVGMPGRALRSPLTEKLAMGGKARVTGCTRCLQPCNPAETPYCITGALTAAVKGDWENGLFFCGSNAYRIDKIMPVKELIRQLTDM